LKYFKLKNKVVYIYKRLQMTSIGSYPSEELLNQMVEAVKATFLASGGNLAYFDDDTVRKDVMNRLAGVSSDDDDGTCRGGSGPPPMTSEEKQQETIRTSPYLAALAASRMRKEVVKKEEVKKEEENKVKKKE
jgi:hypothetical protein